MTQERFVDREDKKQIAKRDLQEYIDIGTKGSQVINESGLYALIFGSKLESAKRFKKWVTSEVLPSIRKTGSYARMAYKLCVIIEYTSPMLLISSINGMETVK